MPELPEVETIKLGLQKKIIGLQIKKIQVLSPKSFIGDPKKVEGLKVLKIWRKAKILGMDLGNATSPVILGSEATPESKKEDSGQARMTLLFHMKMSGQLIFDNGKRFVGGHPTPDMVLTMPNKHTRVIFTLSDGSSYVLPKAKGKVPQGQAKISDSEARSGFLYFNDQRKFGWVKVVDSSSLKEDKLLNNLGPEPLEKGFTWQILKQNLLRHKSMPVKVAVMDQSVVSGVGNIYSNEACFIAKLDPRTKVGKLTDEQFKKLYSGIIKALEEGIKYGGATRAHFVNPEGKKGYFLDYANVYGKEGYDCNRCAGKVEKIALGGRGTYFCPSCQKE